MVRPTSQCSAAAKLIALETIPTDSDRAAERKARKERAALQKDLAGKCNNYFNPKAYDVSHPQPDDAHTVLTALSVTDDIVAAITNRVKAFAADAPDASSNSATIGQDLSKTMTELGDTSAVPPFAFGNTEAGKDPAILPAIAPSSIDYSKPYKLGGVDHNEHNTPANIKKVAAFLKKVQTVATKAWVDEANKGAPVAAVGAKPATVAWFALRRLQAFAAHVTNLPATIKAEFDKVNLVIDGAINLPAVCGNGKFEDKEVCDDGQDNGKPGKCNNKCTGLVPITYVPKVFELSVGGVGGLTSDGINPLDEQAKGALRDRRFIPGTTDNGSNTAGIGGLTWALRFRVAEWGRSDNTAGGFWLGIRGLHVWEQSLAALNLPASLSTQTRADMLANSAGHFDVTRMSIALTLGVSFVKDLVDLEILLGYAKSTYTGDDGKVFTGSPNTTGNGIPTARQLSLSASQMLFGALAKYNPQFTGNDSGTAGFGMDIGLLLAGMFTVSDAEKIIRFSNHTVTYNPNAFLALVVVEFKGIFGDWF